jgi:hypothetical protein
MGLFQQPVRLGIVEDPSEQLVIDRFYQMMVEAGLTRA